MLGKQGLKKVGLKVTLPRLKVLEILETSDNRHMSAEEIYHQVLKVKQDVSFATIYRILNQFENSNIVKKLYFEDNTHKYEIINEHHDHLICVKCNKIQEFVDNVIEEHQKNIAKKYNFQLTDHNLNLYGICEECS
ncbi:Ferric uptake regulation protein FUR [hydrothermal vent metagenome]|uniref:Ferric uptake regulation protein FUR n=1 Tax=hydrothermal vent metagenome TaxID=652676 RepID=A0A1W1BQB3_9ZZZZ